MVISPTVKLQLLTRLISEKTYRVSEQDVSEMTCHHLNEGRQSIILIALLNIILLCPSLTKRRSFKIGYLLKASIPLQRIRGIKSLNFVSLLADVSH